MVQCDETESEADGWGGAVENVSQVRGSRESRHDFSRNPHPNPPTETEGTWIYPISHWA